MNIKKITSSANGYPALLSQIPSPPKQLYCLGKPLEELEKKPAIAIIGSRNVSPYGRHVTEELASGLARNGLVIVSGLAMGVDGIAHHATVEAGGTAIAVLPCGLDRIYPATNHNLAKKHFSSRRGTSQRISRKHRPAPRKFCCSQSHHIRVISGRTYHRSRR